ncbi:MAG: (deoxy)nucleoside triphosphate pyrophosphohydrolase [Pirellulales bacterium]|nr:(deoxy)nucleoside triphosphate pyrophosphohydrolase [Pirellulales bacterium]
MHAIVAIAVVRHQDRFLVGIRPFGTALAGFAEFPGGKAHPGESPAAAAVRECREESGLTVEAVDELLCTAHQYDHGLLEIHFFECRPTHPTQRPKSPFHWAERKELAQLNFPPANAPLTALLLAN